MHEIERTSVDVIQELRSRLLRMLAEPGMTQALIAQRAGVDQSTVSRIVDDRRRSPRRFGSGLKRLCVYAGVPFRRNREPAWEYWPNIAEAIGEVWDGSDLHERQIARLIRAAAAAAPAVQPETKGEGYGGYK